MEFENDKVKEAAKPIEKEKIQIVFDFIVRASERAQNVAINERTNWVAAGAAVASALFALAGAIATAYLGSK